MPLLDGYLPTLALTLGYLLIVWLGPKWMKPRQPYSCRGAMMLYNLGITILSLGMFSEVNRPRVNTTCRLTRFLSGSRVCFPRQPPVWADEDLKTSQKRV